MAKSKKTTDESASKPVAKAPKKAAPKAKPASGGGSPLIDTSMAAANAARMLGAGLNKSSGSTESAKPESAMFKQLKAGLNKPAGSTMSNLLDKSHGPATNRPNQAFNKQVGHNQTFNADITRSGVPRRNPG